MKACIENGVHLPRRSLAHRCFFTPFLLAGWLATSAQAGVVFTNLYSFTGTNDGANPQAGLVQGTDGNFYGTTYAGGTKNWGTVFKISTNGALTSLYSFTGHNDGANPAAGLVQGSDGYFYGTTYLGLNIAGTVFKIATNGVLTTLITFRGGITETAPLNPSTALVQGSDGNFYGTSSAYNNGNEFNFGTEFEMSTNGALLNVQYLSLPSPSALVQGSDGNFYGTSYGRGYPGSVFRINLGGGSSNLYSFTGANDGRYPIGPLVQGSDGTFYGMTAIGGTNGYGTVFQINTNGALTSLYSFTSTNDDEYSYAGLVRGSNGYLYGTTYGGGSSGNGTVFAVNTNGMGFRTLHSFSAVSDGAGPLGGLLLVGNTLYGTTSAGGSSGYGTVFSLTLPVPPPLTIIADGANVVLAWSAAATGFTTGYALGSATNLVPPVAWQTNSMAPIVIGGQDVIINPFTGSQQFFRLFSP